MHCIIIAIIIILIFIITYKIFTRRESMTRIYRGVGALNDGDETPVAAGVVNSMPVFDYTYTYWDGAKTTSCDDCPNEIVCPSCPQYANTQGNLQLPVTTVTSITDSNNLTKYNHGVNEHFSPPSIIPGSEIRENHPIFDSGYINWTPKSETFVNSGVTIEEQPVRDSDYILHAGRIRAAEDFHVDPIDAVEMNMQSVGPKHDLDSDWLSSRERVGACTNLSKSLCGRAMNFPAYSDYPDMTKSDEIFDSENKIAFCKGRGSYENIALNLLYRDIMGLENPAPSCTDHEYISTNGNYYKEPCEHSID